MVELLLSGYSSFLVFHHVAEMENDSCMKVGRLSELLGGFRFRYYFTLGGVSQCRGGLVQAWWLGGMDKPRPLSGVRFDWSLALSRSTVRACLYGMIRDGMVW